MKEISIVNRTFVFTLTVQDATHDYLRAVVTEDIYEKQIVCHKSNPTLT